MSRVYTSVHDVKLSLQTWSIKELTKARVFERKLNQLFFLNTEVKDGLVTSAGCGQQLIVPQTRPF